MIDTEPPTITPCPLDMLVSTDLGSAVATVNWTIPTISDNVGVTSNMTVTPPVVLAIGTHNFTYYAEDAVGLNTSCFFTITVQGMLPFIVTYSNILLFIIGHENK